MNLNIVVLLLDLQLMWLCVIFQIQQILWTASWNSFLAWYGRWSFIIPFLCPCGKEKTKLHMAKEKVLHPNRGESSCICYLYTTLQLSSLQLFSVRFVFSQQFMIYCIETFMIKYLVLVDMIGVSFCLSFRALTFFLYVAVLLYYIFLFGWECIFNY